MAELFKRPGVDSWYAWITDPRVARGRVRRTTKCRVKAEARAMAEAMQADVDTEIAAAIAHTESAGKPILYWSDATAIFLKTAPLKTSTVHSYTSLVRVTTAAFGDFNLRDLTLPMIKEFVATRRLQAVPVATKKDGRIVKDATIRRNISFMSAVYDFVIDREVPGAPEESPFLKYNRRSLKESPLVDRNLRPEQFRDVLAACQTEEHRHIVKVLVGTGMRTAELLGLTWDEVDLTTGFIEFGNLDPDRAKTSHARRVPLPDLVVEALGTQLGTQKKLGTFEPKGLVFPSPRGDGQRPNLSGLLRRIKRVTGIELYTNHALRSTFASWGLQQGVDPIAIQHVVGHSTMYMTTRYAHHTTDSAAAQIRSIRYPVGTQNGTQMQRSEIDGEQPTEEKAKDIS